MSLSPSKLGEARDCIRRFAWNVVDPLPWSQSPEADWGTKIHEQAELYHVRGQAPSGVAGKYFLPALPFVPRPLSGRAEGKFEFRVGKLQFRGLIDLFCTWQDMPACPAGYKGPWPVLPPDTPVVIDYKSVKALSTDKMLKDEAEFLNDPQALIYAAKTLVQFKPATQVLVWWIYLRRGPMGPNGEPAGKPGVQVQWAVLSLAQVTEAFGRIIHPLATQLVQIRTNKTDPLSLPANPDSCMRYGPKYACPRIQQCNLDPLESMKGLDDMRDLLSELEEETGPAESETKPEPGPAEKKSAPASKPKGINPEPLKAEPTVQNGAGIFPPVQPAGYEVNISFRLNDGQPYPPAREGSARGRGANLDEALKAALDLLPR